MGSVSVLQERLPPGEAVVWSVREGEDGRVHQLPHPRVPLLLTATETQVRNLNPKKIKVTSAVWPLPYAATNMEILMDGTFRTTWTKSLGLSGLRPCSWRVQASRDDAWATISTLFPTKGGSMDRIQDQTMKQSIFQMLRRLFRPSPPFLQSDRMSLVTWKLRLM